MIHRVPELQFHLSLLDSTRETDYNLSIDLVAKMHNLVARRHCSELVHWASFDDAIDRGISFLAVDKDSGGYRFLASLEGSVVCLPAEGAEGTSEVKEEVTPREPRALQSARVIERKRESRADMHCPFCNLS